MFKKVQGMAESELGPIKDENGACLLGYRQKANFMGKYLAGVCKASGPPLEESPLPPTDHPSEAPITMAELEREINGLDPKKATGPDRIANLFVMHMGPLAKRALLHLVNLTWQEGTIPAGWRNAHLRLLPKPGKDKSRADAYRPIALTSNLAKVAEKVVNSRMKHLLFGGYEGVDPIHPCQAGFTPHRSSEEQVAEVFTKVEEQRLEGKTSIVMLFDFAKAFDKVDKGLLRLKLLKRRLPSRFIRWTSAFLRGRKAAVKIDDVVGEFSGFETGLPQGTVTAPLLFLCFVDDLARSLTKLGVFVSLFADDLAVVVTGNSEAAARAEAQKVLDLVSKWTEENRMALSTGKTAAIIVHPPKARRRALQKPVFHTERQRVRMRVERILKVVGPTGLCSETPEEASADSQNLKGWYLREVDGEPFSQAKLKKQKSIAFKTATFAMPLKFVKSHPLLGITLDDSWQFVAQAEKAKKRFRIRALLLHKLANTAWGNTYGVLRQAYQTYVQPAWTYGVGVWGLSVPRQTGKDLEALHYKAAKYVIGCPLSAKREAVYAEAGLQPFATLAAYEATRVRQLLLRSARAPSDRLAGTSNRWQKETDKVAATTGLAKAKIVRTQCTNSFAPWEAPPTIHIGCKLDGGFKKSGDAARNRRAAEEKIGRLPPADVTICTDGSLTTPADGLPQGSYGIVVETKEGLTTLAKNIGLCHSSFLAELRAIVVALMEACSWAPGDRRVLLVLTDSQSALAALKDHQRNGVLERLAWRALKILATRWQVYLQYVPSHCGIPGNERADEEATKAHGLPAAKPVIDYDMVKAIVKKGRKEYRCQKLKAHPYHLLSPGPKPSVDKRWSRQEQAAISALRVGASPMVYGFAQTGGNSPLAGTYVRGRTARTHDGLCSECGAKYSLAHAIEGCPTATAYWDLAGLAPEDRTTRHVVGKNPHLALGYFASRGLVPQEFADAVLSSRRDDAMAEGGSG
ncbi:RNA-directed DNA polymerase from mobile element jockey [Diplonema papillatum]|nr:RNA-directed DNA polymerase from mobile element jockey [Diplonema papillatum]KAJ9437898.1 RNA-directed DNA polymerase from mobile element jockey [Diplonema papillatum]KAJ9439100.1 RNA-directed DNA polymerase from mobile element jockey [Diplonema papillatum]KAJ9443476.1 RNA-directed DNA polymerase from mobile element jockey [Diplonema papillatum]KAJ9444069.1 RNA-directed DNA polymerase from mobile element jockey [Diplonema papillatum]